MSAKLLLGKPIAESIMAKAKETIARENLSPSLAVILVGEDPASKLYVSLKEKAAREAGIRFTRYDFNAETDERIIVEKVRALSTDAGTHAILVQLPLPASMNPNEVIAAMDPKKDVDGFHPKNSGVLSPVIGATLALLKETGETKGKTALVIAKSQVFAQTFSDALWAQGIKAEPTWPEEISKAKDFDIVITATGKAGALTGVMVKPGATVIDIGSNKVDGKVVGDAAPEVAEVASWFTPVPGGVGPLTIAMLVQNVVELSKH